MVFGNASSQFNIKIFFIILNSPIFLKSSFLLGRLVLRFSIFKNTLSPSFRRGPLSFFLLQYSRILSRTNLSVSRSIPYILCNLSTLTAAYGTFVSGPQRSFGSYPQFAKNGEVFVILVLDILQVIYTVSRKLTQLSYSKLI